VLAVVPAQGGQRSRRCHVVHTWARMPRSVKSASAIRPILSSHGAH